MVRADPEFRGASPEFISHPEGGKGGGGRRHLTQSVGHLPFTCLLLMGTALLANRCPLLSLSSWPLLTPLCCHSADYSSCCCSLHLPLAYDGFDSGSNLVISALSAFSSWPKAQSSHKKCQHPLEYIYILKRVLMEPLFSSTLKM